MFWGVTPGTNERMSGQNLPSSHSYTKDKIYPDERTYNSTKVHGVTPLKTVNFLVNFKDQTNLKKQDGRISRFHLFFCMLLMTSWNPREFPSVTLLWVQFVMFINIRALWFLFTKHLAMMQPINTSRTDAGGRVVSSVNIKMFRCWDRGIEWRSRLVFVACCAGSGLCEQLIVHSEES